VQESIKISNNAIQNSKNCSVEGHVQAATLNGQLNSQFNQHVPTKAV
jgi:hypothetical protein